MFKQSSLEFSSHKTNCNKSPDLFCFLCASFITTSKNYKLNETNGELYAKCYGKDVLMNGASKQYSSSKLCPNCVTNMKDHLKSKKPLKYSSPAQWNEIDKFQPHEFSCYVCLANKTRNHQYKISYEWPSNRHHNVTSPILNLFDHLQVPKLARLISSSSASESECETEPMFVPHSSNTNSKELKLFDQSSLNDLIRDLELSKEQSLVLASNLKSRNLLTKECRISHYENRNCQTLAFFDEENGIPYLSDIKGLFCWLNVEYVSSEWRLFMDSSKSAFKCVLLHNGNKYPSVPLLYSKNLKEIYTDCQFALNLIKYYEHKWKVIADLKLLNVICGIGCASVKNPCILCNWRGIYRSNKRHLQYHQSNLLSREESFNVGIDSVVANSLIDLADAILPPLHVKIGLVAQFIKTLATDSPAYHLIAEILSHKSTAKLGGGQLDGTEIRKLFKHSTKLKTLFSTKEKRAWTAFENICNYFLGKDRAPNYKELAAELVVSYEEMGYNMSYKLHIMDYHLEDFPSNCSDYSDEMGERFHQDIKSAEKRYQGRCNTYMLADYCWFLKRETHLESRKNSRRVSFPPTN